MVVVVVVDKVVVEDLEGLGGGGVTVEGAQGVGGDKVVGVSFFSLRLRHSHPKLPPL